MSKLFYNMADKNASFAINCKILVTRDTEKQTLLLAGYKHATIIDFKRNFLCKTNKENFLIYLLMINGN